MMTCPSEHELQAFQLGNLPCPLLDALAAHLEMCPACEAKAATLDRATDSILSALRTPSGVPSSPPAEHPSTWPRRRGHRRLALWPPRAEESTPPPR